MWAAVGDIAQREGISRAAVVRRANANRQERQSLTSAIRVYVVQYYRSHAAAPARASAKAHRRHAQDDPDA